MHRVITEWLGNGYAVGQLSQKAQNIRRCINLRKDDLLPEHPMTAIAKNFHLASTDLVAKTVPARTRTEGKKMKVIQDERALRKCAKDLGDYDEIAIDCEGDNEFSYLYMTALIQISTYDTNYIIDTVKLYEFIGKVFAPVFLDGKVNKILFGTTDIMQLQKDFGLFFVGVIDIQDIFLQKFKLKSLPAFKTVISHYLRVDESEIEKQWQMFPWRLRPLPEGALEYAERDSDLLYCVWQMMKIQENEFLRGLDFDISITNERIIKKFKFPKVSHEKLFNACKKSKYHRVSELSHPAHETVAQDVFMTVIKWAEMRASTVNLPRTKVLDNKELIDIALERPVDEKELTYIVSKIAFWDKFVIKSLLNAIKTVNVPNIRCVIENDYYVSKNSVSEKDSFNDSGIVALQADEPMEVDMYDHRNENGKNSNITCQVTVEIEKPSENANLNENILDIHAPVDELFETCSQQYDFRNDDENVYDIPIVESSKGLISNYDFMSDFDLDNLSNEEVANNFEIIRHSKLHNRQINKLRRRKFKYIHGVSKIHGINKRK